MKIIVPMAGRGSRLRPHTLVTPKPLVPIAGEPIVQRLVKDIVDLYDGAVDEIAFVIGDFGKEVEEQLKGIAEGLGAKGSVYHQEEPLGTAHAIWQAKDSMDDEIIIAFADTLFRADFTLDQSRDGVIWVKKVEDPRAFGVVTLDDEGVITQLVEKPQEFVSDLAIIGIYYIKDGAGLANEIKYLLDNDIKDKGEYQLTNALENLKKKGAKIVPGEVKEWMDCGNKNAVLDTTHRVLDHEHAKGNSLVSDNINKENVVIVPPCHIGDNVKLTNCIIGPYVSIENNCEINNSVISNSIVRAKSKVNNAVLDQAMISTNASVNFEPQALDIGDYSRV